MSIEKSEVTGTLKVACIQLTSSGDIKKNLNKCESLIGEAKKTSPDLIILPEYFAWLGNPEKFFSVAPDINKEAVAFSAEMAKRHGVYLIAGGIATPAKSKMSPDEKPYNSSIAFSPEGQEIARYSKIHLFHANLATGAHGEDQIYAEGTTPAIVTIKGFKIGLAICNDIRYPELFRFYSEKEVHAVAISAAFTKETGKVHWHPLLRARAIENQFFILAGAQYGNNIGKLETWGHSMIVSPWGEIMQELPEGEGAIADSLSLDQLAQAKKRCDVIGGRRLRNIF